MKSLLLQLNLTLLLVFSSNLIFAQSIADTGMSAPAITTATESTEPEVAEEEGEKKSAFEISGFVDVYYQYSFNKEPFPTSFTETHNSFTPGMANVVFAKEGKVGFKADIAVGPRAEVADGYSGTTLSAIKQLFVTYSPNDQLTFTLGNFGTHVGYEVIDAPTNINYSTSYMFSNGPFYHTGLKADYALSENFGAMIGIFDDTDTKIDVIPGKHVGAQLSYSNDAAGIFLNYIGGKTDEFVSDSVTWETFSHQVDLTATFQATEELGLGINATTKTTSYTELDNTSWFGAALYANYAFSNSFTLGFRGEYIGDADGDILGVVDNAITDLTLSGNINIGPFKLIPEFRVDLASKEVFTNADGDPTKTSSAVLVAAMYSF